MSLLESYNGRRKGKGEILNICEQLYSKKGHQIEQQLTEWASHSTDIWEKEVPRAADTVFN